VPQWGNWNDMNSGGGAQQYTLVFDQLLEQRSVHPTSMEQPQRATTTQATRQDLYDNVPKVHFHLVS
jgi:hypothetical protein